MTVVTVVVGVVVGAVVVVGREMTVAEDEGGDDEGDGSPEAPASSMVMAKTSMPPWMPMEAVVPIMASAFSSKGVRVGAMLSPPPVFACSSRQIAAFFLPGWRSSATSCGHLHWT